jgi:hypothetical protein
MATSNLPEGQEFNPQDMPAISQVETGSDPWSLLNQILQLTPLAPLGDISQGIQGATNLVKGKKAAVTPGTQEPQMAPSYATESNPVQQSNDIANSLGPQAAPSQQHGPQMSPDDIMKTNPAVYQQKIMDNMKVAYQQQYGWMSKPTVSFQQFFNQWKNNTNGFDPSNPLSAHILYLNDYDGADQFSKNVNFVKNLSAVNFNKAMDYWPGGMGGIPEWAEDRLTSLGFNNNLKDAKNEYSKLMQAITQGVPNANVPAIEKMFNNMRGTKTKAQMYTQFLNTMQNTFGVRLRDMDNNGLTPEYFKQNQTYNTPENLQPGQIPAGEQ